MHLSWIYSNPLEEHFFNVLFFSVKKKRLEKAK